MNEWIYSKRCKNEKNIIPNFWVIYSPVKCFLKFSYLKTRQGSKRIEIQLQNVTRRMDVEKQLVVQVTAHPEGSRTIKGWRLKETQRATRPSKRESTYVCSLFQGSGRHLHWWNHRSSFCTMIGMELYSGLVDCLDKNRWCVDLWLLTGTVNLHIHNWTLIKK